MDDSGATTQTDPIEMLSLVRAVREHLAWLARGGVRGVPRGAALPPAEARPAPPPASQPAPRPVPLIERPTAVPPARAPSEAQVATAPAPLAARPAPPPEYPSIVPAPVHAAAEGGAPAGDRPPRSLPQIRDQIGDCQRCKLAGGRTQIVFGTGNPHADLLFAGEGPGEDEDLQGEPFVGKAGQLLTRMIAAMGFDRSDVYICNVVKCRPPKNRTPEPDEIAACLPFLEQQIATVSPRIIVALGKTAATTLLGTSMAITRLRGRFHDYRGILLMPTYHPAYLLRTPSAKREVWEDLQKVMAKLDEMGVVRPRAQPSGPTGGD